MKASTRCANPNTRRAYGTVLDTLLTDLDPDRALTGISGDELAEVVEGTWGGAAPATWNRNRAALSSFLAWCAKNRYPAPVLPPGLERRVEHPDETRALPRAAIERQLSPPVPSKTRDGVSLRVAVDAFMSSSWRSAAYRSLDASLQRHLAAPLGAAPAEQPLTAPLGPGSGTRSSRSRKRRSYRSVSRGSRIAPAGSASPRVGMATLRSWVSGSNPSRLPTARRSVTEPRRTASGVVDRSAVRSQSPIGE